MREVLPLRQVTGHEALEYHGLDVHIGGSVSPGSSLSITHGTLIISENVGEGSQIVINEGSLIVAGDMGAGVRVRLASRAPAVLRIEGNVGAESRIESGWSVHAGDIGESSVLSASRGDIITGDIGRKSILGAGGEVVAEKLGNDVFVCALSHIHVGDVGRGGVLVSSHGGIMAGDIGASASVTALCGISARVVHQGAELTSREGNIIVDRAASLSLLHPGHGMTIAVILGSYASS